MISLHHSWYFFLFQLRMSRKLAPEANRWDRLPLLHDSFSCRSRYHPWSKDLLLSAARLFGLTLTISFLFDFLGFCLSRTSSTSEPNQPIWHHRIAIASPSHSKLTSWYSSIATTSLLSNCLIFSASLGPSGKPRCPVQSTRPVILALVKLLGYCRLTTFDYSHQTNTSGYCKHLEGHRVCCLRRRARRQTGLR